MSAQAFTFFHAVSADIHRNCGAVLPVASANFPEVQVLPLMTQKLPFIHTDARGNILADGWLFALMPRGFCADGQMTIGLENSANPI
jgi:hypothetical protein